MAAPAHENITEVGERDIRQATVTLGDSICQLTSALENLASKACPFLKPEAPNKEPAGDNTIHATSAPVIEDLLSFNARIESLTKKVVDIEYRMV